MPLKIPTRPIRTCSSASMLPADAEATRDMAYVFAEEFARMGYDREQIALAVQESLLRRRPRRVSSAGRDEILAIIDECLNVWGSNSGCRSRRSNCPLDFRPPPRSRGRNDGGRT